MIGYKWQIFPYSGEMYTATGAAISKRLNATGGLADNRRYNTTDFLPLNDHCRVVRVVCPLPTTATNYPRICCYMADKTTTVGISEYKKADGTTVPIVTQFADLEDTEAYFVLPESAAYIRVSVDGDVWNSCSIQAYGAYRDYGTRTDVNPIYKDDLGIGFEVEGKNRFLRRKLTGRLSFVGSDFDTIMSYGADVAVRVVLQKGVNGGAFSDYWEGEFARADSTITFDDEKIEATPDVSDVYKSIIDRYEEQFNLIDLAPEAEDIRYTQRPLLQIYTPYTSVVQNVAPSRMSWEDDVSDPEESTLTGRWKFAQAGASVVIHITSVSYPQLNGYYVSAVPFVPSRTSSYETDFVCSSGCRLHYTIATTTSQGTTYYNYGFVFYDSLGVQKYTFNYSTVSWGSSLNLIKDTLRVGDTFELGGHIVDGEVSQIVHFYARYLCNDDYNMQLAHKIEASDPFIDTETNYHYIHTPADVAGSFNEGLLTPIKEALTATDRYTNVPTKYGRVEESVETELNAQAGTTGVKYYYLPPDDVGWYVPVSQTKWGAFTFWLDMAAFGSPMRSDTLLGNIVLLRDAYTLQSCIEVLAKRIDPRLTFKATTEYSKFLFGTSNPVYSSDGNPFFHLCITQITNVSRGEYSQAAQRGEACLKWFFDLLKNAFNCFWWVDDEYKIHIEHISYFDNGGTYSPSTEPQQVGKDLTVLYNTRNNLKWTFGLGECQFEKTDVAMLYSYEWSMGATDLFNGNAIEVMSRTIDRSSKEEISVSHFAADIDYVIARPSDFSRDGWLLLAPQWYHEVLTDEHFYAIVIEAVNFAGLKKPDGTLFSFLTANRSLSFAYLQSRYLTFGMPASTIICNGSITAAKSLDRMMTQKVTVPYEDGEIETGKLIRTSIGDGQIKRAVFNLSSRCAEITLKYPMQ